MVLERDFHVVLVTEKKGVGAGENPNVDKTIKYSGLELKIKL